MTIDLTRPEHRNALFNACTLTPEERAHYLAHMGDDNGPCVQFCRALSSPTGSAALVRALLEGCGATSTLGHPFDVRLDEAAAAADVHVMLPAAKNAVGFRRRADGWAYRWIDNVPALVLRLLACTTREEALAALKEAGR